MRGDERERCGFYLKPAAHAPAGRCYHCGHCEQMPARRLAMHRRISVGRDNHIGRAEMNNKALGKLDLARDRRRRRLGSGQHRHSPRRDHQRDLVRGGRRLRLSCRLPLLQRLDRRQGAGARPHAGHACRAVQQRARLRSHQQMGGVRPPLRRYRRPGPADRTYPGDAVWLPAGHHLDPGGRRPGRLRAGHGDHVLLHPPRRAQSGADGARRAGPGRRLGGAGRHDDDHDHPDRRAGPGHRQRHVQEPVGDRDRPGHHPGGHADRHLYARHPARARYWKAR